MSRVETLVRASRRIRKCGGAGNRGANPNMMNPLLLELLFVLSFDTMLGVYSVLHYSIHSSREVHIHTCHGDQRRTKTARVAGQAPPTCTEPLKTMHTATSTRTVGFRPQRQSCWCTTYKEHRRDKQAMPGKAGGMPDTRID